MYYVYHLINPITNLPFYVGQTKYPNRREMDHLNPSCNPNSLVSRYINTLLSEGVVPTLEILYEIKDREDVMTVEYNTIMEYFTKYTIMNVSRRDPSLGTNLYKKPATREEAIENCGNGGVHCGIFYGDVFCVKCREHEMIRRAEIVISHLKSAPTLFCGTTNAECWQNIRRTLVRRSANYLKVPISDVEFVVAIDRHVSCKNIVFNPITLNDAIELLTKEPMLFVVSCYQDGNKIPRSSSKGWPLTIKTK